MGLHSMAQVLSPAIKQPWAVGAYDVVNLAMVEGVLAAAETDLAPVLILVYPHSVPSHYFKPLANFVREESQRRNVQTAIVLDHGSSIDQIRLAIDAGFTGVMIDASALPFEDNIVRTSEVVQFAKKNGVSVEAELGHVGEGDDGLSAENRRAMFTDADQVREFAERTQVDALAISIGTAHGVYHFEPELDIERLKQIREQVDIALVLHGSSGTPEAQLQKAIGAGIDKINVYTDIRLKVMQEIHTLLTLKAADKLDIIDLDSMTRIFTQEVVRQKNLLFGSVGKANAI